MTVTGAWRSSWLSERFDADGMDLQRDVDDFLQVLRREGVVPLDFALEEEPEGEELR